MTRDECKVVIAMLRNVYPKDCVPTQTAFDMWYLLLQDLPFPVAEAAAVKYMQTGKFAPTPADIREIAAEIMTPQEEGITEDEAVLMLTHAISRSGYYAEEEFAKLPEIMRRVIVSPARLREMGLMDTEKFQSVEVSHFRRSFRAEKERMRQEAMVSPEVKGKIGQIRQEAGIEEKEVDMIESG